MITNEIKHLYKYREFNQTSLTMLCENNIFFASPRKFNDPLDCSPTIEIDMDIPSLEKLTFDVILEEHGRDRAISELNSCQLNGGFRDENYDFTYDKGVHAEHLASNLLNYINNKFSSFGICAFSASWKSPLLWSHYADEHRGICVEYDVGDLQELILGAVKYEQSRCIKTSIIHDWFYKNDTSAIKTIKQKFFYNKAKDWKYEEEWRLISEKVGKRERPFKITAIYFGMRTSFSVQSSLAKTMGSNVSYYGVYAPKETFHLEKRSVSFDELCSLYPRDTASEAFGGKPSLSGLKFNDDHE